MTQNTQQKPQQWSSRLSYILAVTGSAVGLGNIWKFPYITGEHGGGAFVLVYLCFILLIGVPVMMAEVLLGRRGRKTPGEAVRALCLEAGVNPAWQVAGWLGILTGFLILTFYVVIAGWAVAYIFYAMTGQFVGQSSEQISTLFSGLTREAPALISWSFVIILMMFVIVAAGVHRGLERAVRYLMPSLVFLLFVLVGYAMQSGQFETAVRFLFEPDFSKLTASGILVALGHACFTLGLASGILMMYGAYLQKNASIAKTSLVVAFADTGIALLAGLAIFPIVFSQGLEPSEGPGLIFLTLPIAFGQMPYGTLMGVLFFTMLVFAALTSAISLIEAVVAWFVERFKVTRLKAAVMAAFSVWLLSLGTVFSFSHPDIMKIDWTWIGIPHQVSFFDSLDYLSANILLPVGALLVAVLCGWVLKQEVTQDELKVGRVGFALWRLPLRYLAPIAILIVFANAIGLVG